jgi:hypothetical protein
VTYTGTGADAAEYLRAQARQKLEQAQGITKAAEKAKRPLATHERGQVEALLAEVTALNEERKGIDDSLALVQQVDDLNAKMSGGSVAPATKGLGDWLLEAGLCRKSADPLDGLSVEAGRRVEIASYPIFGAKTTTIPPVGDIAPRAPSSVEPLGRDERFMYSAMRQVNLGVDLSIRDFRESVRSTTGTVERDPTAVTGKATLNVTVVAVNTAVKQEAVILDGVPNAILESVPSFREFAESELRFRLATALDLHTYSAVNLAATFGTSGTTMIEKLRNGITAMQADGYSPTLAVLNPTDAAALDLSADAGGFVFPVRDTGTSSPLWSMRVITRLGTAEPPLLVDVDRIGPLYLSGLRVALDPYSGVSGDNFETNRTDLRAEFNCLMHVRSPKAARRIAAT